MIELVIVWDVGLFARDLGSRRIINWELLIVWHGVHAAWFDQRLRWEYK